MESIISIFNNSKLPKAKAIKTRKVVAFPINSPKPDVLESLKSGFLVRAKRRFSLAAKIAPRKAIHNVKC